MVFTGDFLKVKCYGRVGRELLIQRPARSTV